MAPVPNTKKTSSDDVMDVSLGAGLYLAGVLEFLIADIFNKAVTQIQHKPIRIDPHHITVAICNDSELAELFQAFRLQDRKTCSQVNTSEPTALCPVELCQYHDDCCQPGINSYPEYTPEMNSVNRPHEDALDVVQVLMERRQLQKEVCNIYPGLQQRVITGNGVFKQNQRSRNACRNLRNTSSDFQKPFFKCMVYVRGCTSQIMCALRYMTDTFGEQLNGVHALVERYIF